MGEQHGAEDQRGEPDDQHTDPGGPGRRAGQFDPAHLYGGTEQRDYHAGQTEQPQSGHRCH
jgi:hypothetical protein